MKREKLIKLVGTELSKCFEMGLRQSPTDAENSEFYRPMIDLDITPKLVDKILASHPEERKSAEEVLAEGKVMTKKLKEEKPLLYHNILKAMEEYASQSKGYPEECEWEYDEDYSCYDTSCDNAYCLLDGTLEENNHKYCPYCGKPIKVKENIKDK